MPYCSLQLLSREPIEPILPVISGEFGPILRDATDSRDQFELVSSGQALDVAAQEQQFVAPGGYSASIRWDAHGSSPGILVRILQIRGDAKQNRFSIPHHTGCCCYQIGPRFVWRRKQWSKVRCCEAFD